MKQPRQTKTRKKKRGEPHRPRLTGKSQSAEQLKYLLESGTLTELILANEITNDLLRFYWDFYSELAYQRNEIEKDLTNVLNESATSDYRFKKWQRAVKYKYSLHPLSTAGSLGCPGGRFNIGDVNPNIQNFPALYLTEDKDTALQEILGPTTHKNSGLTPQEIALTSPNSIAIVSVSGKLEKIFDLRSAKRLAKFVNLVKKFSLSQQLLETATQLNAKGPSIIKKPKDLQKVLLEKNWRINPVQYDIPSSSQIFGGLVYRAGIEGILYESKFTKKECLALFPRNFKDSDSFVQLDDDSPHEQVPKRIDSTNWRACDLTYMDLST